MRSQRYSGRWSQNLLTMRWASSPGPARPRAMGAADRGAVANVDAADPTGIRQAVAGTLNSVSGGAAGAVFGGAGAGSAAGGTGSPARRRFSQQVQAYF